MRVVVSGVIEYLFFYPFYFNVLIRYIMLQPPITF